MICNFQRKFLNTELRKKKLTSFIDHSVRNYDNC